MQAVFLHARLYQTKGNVVYKCGPENCRSHLLAAEMGCEGVMLSTVPRAAMWACPPAYPSLCKGSSLLEDLASVAHLLEAHFWLWDAPCCRENGEASSFPPDSCLPCSVLSPWHLNVPRLQLIYIYSQGPGASARHWSLSRWMTQYHWGRFIIGTLLGYLMWGILGSLCDKEKAKWQCKSLSWNAKMCSQHRIAIYQRVNITPGFLEEQQGKSLQSWVLSMALGAVHGYSHLLGTLLLEMGLSSLSSIIRQAY